MPAASQRRIGPLECIIVDKSDDASQIEHLVVLCHGYGASCSDLASLSASWLESLQAEGSRFRFIFPNAPISLAPMGMPGGFAWWPLNMARLMEAMEAQSFEELHSETPPGIQEATDLLGEVVKAAIEELGDAPQTKLTIGGFSQGAMVTMNGTLMDAWTKPVNLIQFSGTLISEQTWKERAAESLAGVRIYQSHGRIDPILPFSGAERLCDLVEEARASIQFHAFDGPHTIDLDSIAHVAEMLCND
ncbi:MAG: lysophospholipase [Planctomycetota bacterium]